MNPSSHPQLSLDVDRKIPHVSYEKLPCTDTPNPWYNPLRPSLLKVFFKQSPRPENSRVAAAPVPAGPATAPAFSVIIQKNAAWIKAPDKENCAATLHLLEGTYWRCQRQRPNEYGQSPAGRRSRARWLRPRHRWPSCRQSSAKTASSCPRPRGKSACTCPWRQSSGPGWESSGSRWPSCRAKRPWSPAPWGCGQSNRRCPCTACPWRSASRYVAPERQQDEQTQISREKLINKSINAIGPINQSINGQNESIKRINALISPDRPPLRNFPALSYIHWARAIKLQINIKRRHHTGEIFDFMADFPRATSFLLFAEKTISPCPKLPLEQQYYDISKPINAKVK